jgi:hypothetical protein
MFFVVVNHRQLILQGRDAWPPTTNASTVTYGLMVSLPIMLMKAPNHSSIHQVETARLK